MELIFRYIFQLIIFILPESSKDCFIFSYFFVVFEKWANLSRQQLLFNHILKKCWIPKDLHITRKKGDNVLISIYLSCTTENFEAMLQCVWDLELVKYNILQPFVETRQKLHKPSCINFSYGFDVFFYLIFYLPNYLIALIN